MRVLSLAVVSWALLWQSPFAAAPRVLPEGKSPDDVRLGELRTLDSYFPFEVPTTPDVWAKRAELTRRRIQVAMGIYPLPEHTPAHAVVHGRVRRDGYTVERVYLESYPGHFVTGSLYRPVGKTGRLPGVMCPHGHWANGRFYDGGEEEGKKEIAGGGEKLMNAARHPLQAHCVQLARMGCVVFHYDMLGNADSQQIPVEIAHGFRNRRPELERNDAWGFFSPQAELRSQSIMGLQTYNSVRALDWFSALPDVDPARIGVTGASGGGTQTFILAAIDPRVTAAFPAVMVSTAMQGGCTCENACYLRSGVGNVDFAACFAPKPLGLTAANDWTVDLETKGLPELKKLYTLLGAPNHVQATIHTEFGHNYNSVSRQAMYHWFNEHLNIGLEEPIEEADFEPLSIAEMTVWDADHPAPPAGPEYEVTLTKTIADVSNAALAADPRRFTQAALEVIVGRGVPGPGEIAPRAIVDRSQGGYRVLTGLVELPLRHEQVPVVTLLPKGDVKRMVIWVDGRGKNALFTTEGEPLPEIKRLIDGGSAVSAPDLIGQGESTADGKTWEENRRVKEDRNFAGYTYGYNSPLFVQRVHDIMTVVGLASYFRKGTQTIELVGVHGAGPLVAVAAAQSGDKVNRVAVDTQGFRFAELTDYADAHFLPGAVKFGDLPGLLGVVGKRPLWLAGESREFADSLQNTLDNVTVGGVSSPKEKAEDYSPALVDWVLSDIAK